MYDQLQLFEDTRAWVPWKAPMDGHFKITHRDYRGVLQTNSWHLYKGNTLRIMLGSWIERLKDDANP